jgi:hypothetical protein
MACQIQIRILGTLHHCVIFNLPYNIFAFQGFDLNVKWAKPVNKQIFGTKKQLGKAWEKNQ